MKVALLSDNETDEIVALGLKLASSADDVKGENIRLLDLRGRCAYTDVMLFVSGASDRQVRAIGDRISKRANELGMPTIGHEGSQSGNWVLADHGDVVVHVFYRPARMYYDLESLWADAPEIPLGFVTEQSPF